VSLKELIISDGETLLKDIMTFEPTSVYYGAKDEVVAKLLQDSDLMSVPVVDKERRIVGSSPLMMPWMFLKMKHLIKL